MKAALNLPVNLKVVYNGGAYTTSTVAGQRASSTSSAETAAGRLVDKLTAHLQLLPGTLVAAPLPAKGLKPAVSMWQIKPNGSGAA
jgi:hypothetical protein